MATIEELLRKLAADKLAEGRNAPLPAPAAPVGMVGPLSTDTTAAFQAANPEPVPPSFVAPRPADQSFVDSYSGPAPTAPTVQQPGLLEKLAAILGGVGAGLQGNAAPFIEQVRSQREAPFRQFERQQEQYQDRRSRGIELAERQAERDADRTNRALEAAYERDFKVWLQKNDFRDDAAKEAMRQVFIRERDARAERLATQRELEREQRARQIEAKQIASRYFTVSRNMALSRELGAYYSGLNDGPLSPAAAKLDAQVQGIGDVRMRRSVDTGGGRVGVSNAATKALANFNGALQEVIGAVSRGDIRGEQMARRKLDAMYGRLSQFPGQIERGIGTGGWPYAKPVGQGAPAPAGQQPQQQPQADPLKIR